MVNIQTSSAMNKIKKPKIKVFPHPVDGGWSWVTLIGTFIICAISGGLMRIFGIFMVEFHKDYDADSATSSLVIGLQFASSGVIGYLAMNVAMKFSSPRQLIMAGGFLGGLGLIINIFAKNIYFFIFSQSLLVGTSIGTIYGPCLYELGNYFDKKKSLANGIAMGGVSFGGLIMSPFARILIDTYALKGAFLILGALHFLIIPAGALLRPQSFYRVAIKQKRTIMDVKYTQNKYISKPKSKAQLTIFSGEKQSESTKYLDIMIETGRKRSYSNKELKMPVNYRNESNTNRLSSSDQYMDRTTSDLHRPDNNNSVKRRKISDPNPPRLRKISDQTPPRTRKISDPTPPQTRKLSEQRKPETVALLQENDELNDGYRPRSPTSVSFSPLARKAMLQRMRSRTESEVVEIGIVHSDLFQSNTSGSFNDNTRRDFYVSSDFLYDISIRSVIMSEQTFNKTANSKNEKNNLSNILTCFSNFGLLRSPTFTLFLTGYVIGCIGCVYPIVFIPPLGDFYGIDKTKVSLVMAITNALDVVGRTGSGILADKGLLGLGRKHIMIIALVICGILNLSNTFYDKFWSITLFSVIYGAVGGTVFAINSSTLSEVVEPDKYRQAVGFLVGLQQLTLGVGGPLAGAFRDFTGTYNATFYFLGCCNFTAVFLLSCLIVYSKYKEQKT